MAVNTGYISISDTSDGVQGRPGTRGAGRWNYRVGNAIRSSGYTQAELNAFLRIVLEAAGVPSDQFFPVPADQLWLFSSPTAEDLSITNQLVYIYDDADGRWLVQEEAIHGNVVVDGTVTGGKLSATTIQGLNLTLGTLSSAPTRERIEISDNRIRVFDNNNRIRVVIGDLS